MGSNSTYTTITLHSPEELIREVPALLGFVPQNSLVAVLLDRTSLRCTLRWDLEHELIAQAIRIIGIAHRAEADGAVLAVYADTSVAAKRFSNGINRAADLLEEQGIGVHDLLWVSEGHWGSYLCAEPTCCPEAGRPLPITTPHLEVSRVANGRPAVAPTREAVRRALEVRPEPEDSIVYQSARELLLGLPLSEVAELAVQTAERLSTVEPDSDDRHDATSRAILVEAVQHIPVRDFVLARLAVDCLDTAPAAAALTRAALQAPERLRGPIAATAMAVLALDGQSSVPLWTMNDLANGESLAALIAAAVQAGFPPAELRDLFASSLPDVVCQLEQRDGLL